MALDKRRAKWLGAQQAVVEAQLALDTVVEQLEAEARQRDVDDAALAEAIQRVADLKKARKASARRRQELRADRQRALRTVKKARQRARAREAKFDSALLADMLRAHKAADLSKNATSAAGAGATPAAAAGNGVARKRAATPSRPRNGRAAPVKRATAAANGRTSR